MAQVLYGGGITDIRGSFGGQTHSRNRFGNYIRIKTKPVNPDTALQQAVKLNAITVSSYWNENLTAAERGQWESYANAIPWTNGLGQTVQLTGFNHFFRSATSLLNAGGVIMDTGPAELSLPGGDPAVVITALETAQALSVVFDDTLEWLDEDGGWMVVQMGTPVNASRNFFKGPWRKADVIEGDSITPPTTPAAMTAPYQIQENQKVFFQIRIIRGDGRVSQSFRVSAIVGA